MKQYRIEIIVKKGNYYRDFIVPAKTKREAKNVARRCGVIFDIIEGLGLPQNSGFKYNIVQAI